MIKHYKICEVEDVTYKCPKCHDPKQNFTKATLIEHLELECQFQDVVCSRCHCDPVPRHLFQQVDHSENHCLRRLKS